MRTKGPYYRLYAETAPIRGLMAFRGITTNRELADKAGVTLETARRFTSGEMVDTTSVNAAKLAQALNVETEYLFVERRSSLIMADLAA